MSNNANATKIPVPDPIADPVPDGPREPEGLPNPKPATKEPRDSRYLEWSLEAAGALLFLFVFSHFMVFTAFPTSTHIIRWLEVSCNCGRGNKYNHPNTNPSDDISPSLKNALTSPIISFTSKIKSKIPDITSEAERIFEGIVSPGASDPPTTSITSEAKKKKKESSHKVTTKTTDDFDDHPTTELPRSPKSPKSKTKKDLPITSTSDVPNNPEITGPSPAAPKSRTTKTRRKLPTSLSNEVGRVPKTTISDAVTSRLPKISSALSTQTQSDIKVLLTDYIKNLHSMNERVTNMEDDLGNFANELFDLHESLIKDHPEINAQGNFIGRSLEMLVGHTNGRLSYPSLPRGTNTNHLVGYLKNIISESRTLQTSVEEAQKRIKHANSLLHTALRSDIDLADRRRSVDYSLDKVEKSRARLQNLTENAQERCKRMDDLRSLIGCRAEKQYKKLDKLNTRSSVVNWIRGVKLEEAERNKAAGLEFLRGIASIVDRFQIFGEACREFGNAAEFFEGAKMEQNGDNEYNMS